MISRARHLLLDWFARHQRDLPLRGTKDPYTVWLMEVILQQTRVEQGMPYFHRFMGRYPDVQSLAAAGEQEVLRLWQGLGYYSRARNMLYTARAIVNDHQGQFPKVYKEILKLKGIGPYTAGMIASVCFDEPIAVVDGNVSRVVSRLFAVQTPINTTKGAKQIQGLADEMLDRPRAGDFNQALMDFGSLVCTPRSPKCRECPLEELCAAREKGLAGQLPRKSPKKKLKERFFHYLNINNGEKIVLEKRAGKDIWAGLWQLPLIESERNNKLCPTDVKAVYEGLKGRLSFISKKEHVLSHQKLIIRFYEFQPAGDHLPEGWGKVPLKELDKYPLPRPLVAFLTEG